MLGSITPLGERGRGSRWGVTVAFLVAGSAAGGLIAGTALGGLGRVMGLGATPGTMRLVVLAALAVVGSLFDAAGSRFPLPTIHRQVNEQWLFQFRGWYYGAGFGFQLGLGVVTIVTTAAVYLCLVAALLSASLVGGGVIGSAFGLVRAGTVLAAARVHSPARLASLGRALDRWNVPSRRATLAGMLAVALAAGTLAAR